MVSHASRRGALRIVGFVIPNDDARFETTAFRRRHGLRHLAVANVALIGA